ncbi:unnamed protein product, partial [Meganyctiphanes norvegica]
MAGYIMEWLLLVALLIIINREGEASKSPGNSTMSKRGRDNRCSCAPPNEDGSSQCDKIKKKKCPWGVVKDICGCCDTCAKACIGLVIPGRTYGRHRDQLGTSPIGGKGFGGGGDGEAMLLC